MTQINPANINNYNNMQTANQKAQPVRIPNYYYVPDDFERKTFKESIKENPIYEMGLKQIVEHPLLVIPTWLALNFGFDAYAHACGGEYEKSLVKKAANLGDRIEGSKLIQNKPVQAVIKGLGSAKNAGGKVVQNSAILRAMRDTPSMPEWSMVKSQLFNQKQEVVQEFIRIADGLKLAENKALELKDIGLENFEKDMLKKVFNVNKISQIPEEKAVNQVLLSRLGRTQEQIKKIQELGADSTEAVKKEIMKEMGLDANKIKLIKEDLYGKYIKDVETATGKVRNRVKIGAGHFSWMGPLTKPFERTIGCDEVYNKLHSMSGGAKTATGRFTSKMMQMIHRGITFSGGKAGLLIFIAPILVELGLNVKKADKDQKIGTAAGGLIESVSWVFTFPLALKMLHSLGGAQYAGMSKEQVEQFRKILEEFNTKNKEGAFATKAEYSAAKKATKEKLKALSKVKGQNILTKGVRKLARFLTLDLETFKGYQGSNPIMNMARKIPNFFKNVAGVPMRLGVWGLISMGVLGTALTKGSRAIFGRSYDAMKQDEHKAEKKTQKQFLMKDLNERLYKTAQQKAQAEQPQVTKLAKTQAEKNAAPYTSKGRDANALNAQEVVVPEEENVDNYTYVPSPKNTIPHQPKGGSQDTYTYIPSSECKIKPDKVDENKRKYIPSQAAANIQKSFDNSGLQSALDRAQRAEDRALKVLAGNFDGI